MVIGPGTHKIKCPKCEYANPVGQALCSHCLLPLPRIQVQAGVEAEATAIPSPVAEALTFRRDQVIANRYTVFDMIGRGGMGCIYRVRDNTLNEDVALKTLLPQFTSDRTVVERFLNEARIARQLSHPNIIRVHDIGISRNVLYISMEYLRGKSLRTMLDKLSPGQKLPLSTILDIFDQLCAALEYAHRFTIHRDIKPENIMVLEGGGVKLMDFGISKLMANTRLTGTSMVMGTPVYMAPEQLRDSSSVDGRADIYSMGVMLYEILTGNAPTGVPRPASQIMGDIPPALDPIVTKCLEPDPNRRYATVTELRNDLKSILKVVETGLEPAPPPVEEPRLWRKVIGLALVAVVLLGSGVGLWKLESRRQALFKEAGRGPGKPAPPVRSELEAIAQRVNQLRVQAETKADSDPGKEPVLNQANRLWERAQAADAQQDTDALGLARQALQCFFGLAFSPPNMVFTPPGLVELRDGAGRTETVIVDGFFMDETEVTNKAYSAFVHQGWRVPPTEWPQPDLPVTMVTFYDAQAYAAWAGKKLPTEAQWARAAYGGPEASACYPWGDEWQPEAANSLSPEDGYPGPAPARAFEKTDRTWSGCYDMAANVSEWTRTEYRDFIADPETDNLENLYFGTSIVVRGGNFLDPNHSYLAARFPQLYESKAPNLGFRCVLEIPTDLERMDQLLAREPQATGQP
jgi:formylglycine-generating enzyme required for sulfatase activity